jgi:hypothetical protein
MYRTLLVLAWTGRLSDSGAVAPHLPFKEGMSMLRNPALVLVLAGLSSAVAFAETPVRAGAPRIFIEPQDGFDSYISAAIVKKHVPAVATTNRDEATFVLTSVVQSKEESTGGKIARCLFAYCIGMEGTQTATVQLVNAKTKEVSWAYNVRKASSGAFQSTAEAIAKHLKKFLEEHPQ